MARGPKSHHADGTPKKRWTPEQRAARGRPPRRGGGRRADNEPPRNRAERRAEQFGDQRFGTRKGGVGRRDEQPRGGQRDGQSRGGKPGRKPVRRYGEPERREDGFDRKPRYRRDDRDTRFEGKPRHDRDDRRPKGDRRDDARSPQHEPDQMSWAAPTIEAEEGVHNGFSELGVADPMVGVLAAQGITQPFAIQEATIRDAISGRDVLGRARTGSGKTLAFGLPLLTRLAQGSGRGSRAVILSPTRELALQIADNLAPLASAVGLRLILVAGGMSYTPQIKAFERGVDVVVATPGRLVDLMQQGAADLSRVEITVLDEADHMAEMGFTDEVTAILDATPEQGQRLLFSATLDEAVGRIVRTYLHDPIIHEVDSDRGSVLTMTHLALHTRPHEKLLVTAEVAAREGRTVIFVRTQKGSDRIAGQLRAAGVMAGALHGGLTQGARARILAAFKAGEVPVLVATDVAARGIHVDDVSLVLQVDPPRDSKDYLHRAGRTARAGTDGTVCTIVLPHQRKMMRRILGQAGVKAETLETRPGADDLAALTGARPAPGEPISEEAYLELIKPKPQPRRSSPRRGGYGKGGYKGASRRRSQGWRRMDD